MAQTDQILIQAQSVKLYDIKSDCKFIWKHILKDFFFFASFPNHRDAIFAVGDP